MIAENVLKIEQDNEHLREENERLRTLLGVELSRTENCELCKFYIQHYIRHGFEYAKTYLGHCTHGRNKNRKPDEKGCKYFANK